MPEYAVFVSSSDNYSDLWPVFFSLFKKYWPEYNGKIYLQTQKKQFVFPGLNIECTNVGVIKDFGATLLAGLNKVTEDNILFFMIDYIFMGRVNAEKIDEYYAHFCNSQLDSLVLCHHRWINTKLSSLSDLQRFVPPSNKIMFSYQIAFWKKKVLKSLILPHENPWMSEWWGDARCEKMNVIMECLKGNVQKPIPYNLAGCLHQGKWLNDAVKFIQNEDLMVDFSKRGFYDDVKGYKSLKSRINIKWSIIKTGILGSYIDLKKRKSIH